MVGTVFCIKYLKELPVLERPPLPGELGLKIQKECSAQAWKDWLTRQTMLINDSRLNLINDSAREYLLDELDKFLFSGDAGNEIPEFATPVVGDDSSAVPNS